VKGELYKYISEEILIKKQEHYGVRNRNLQWFKSYLNDRTQFSLINNVKSEMQSIETGVPQGSILGPLLFILYVNDLPGCVQKCQINMYADDTAIYFSAKNVPDMSSAINSDLKNIYGWFCANKVSVHFGKTETMLISNPQKRRFLPSTDLNVSVTNNETLSQVDNVKYLGITLDDRLSFDSHIDGLAKQISKKIGILKSCKFLSRNTLVHLFNSIVLPHFDYCSSVWCATSSKNLTRLQRLQNRAMRLILRKPHRTHIEDMLDELKWMSVRQRNVFNNMILMWKIVNGFAPTYLSDNITYVNQTHSHFTRAHFNQSISLQYHHKNAFFNHAVTVWNQLPHDLRILETLSQFKKSVSSFIFANVHRF
jgi:hypothetical protein